MLSPWMAGTKTFDGHPATFERAIFLYGFQSIGAAGGRKTALGAKEWGDGPLVKADDGNE